MIELSLHFAILLLLLASIIVSLAFMLPIFCAHSTETINLRTLSTKNIRVPWLRSSGARLIRWRIAFADQLQSGHNTGNKLTLTLEENIF